HEEDNGWQMLLLVSALVLVMSFWAATLMTNAVRAALLTVICFAALFVGGRFGSWCGLNAGGLEAPLLTSIAAHFQLAPDFSNSLLNSNSFQVIPVALFLGVLILSALTQSHAQFRRAQPQNVVIVRYCLILS